MPQRDGALSRARVDPLPLSGRALSREGTPWTLKDLEQLGLYYHGDKGSFVYRAFTWVNTVVFDGRLPIPLLQWALTPYGGCLGFTSPRIEVPVISLHPAIWARAPRHVESPIPLRGWAATIPAGPRYTLDTVLHELLHVDVRYLRGGHQGHSSHDNPVWCAAITEAAARLQGTLLECPPFTARPTERIREDGHHRRRTPADCLPMDAVSRWPHPLRTRDYYTDRAVPFEEADA